MKEKLTLSVNKAVVRKAKKLGINISDITERVLEGYTSAKEPEETTSLYYGYRALFDSILPLLKKFDIRIEIAAEEVAFDDGSIYSLPITLEPDGFFFADVHEQTFGDIEQINLHQFFSPQEIIENLVNALVKSAEGRREKLREIMMAKRIIDAMKKSLIGTEDKRGNVTESAL